MSFLLDVDFDELKSNELLYSDDFNEENNNNDSTVSKGYTQEDYEELVLSFLQPLYSKMAKNVTVYISLFFI